MEKAEAVKGIENFKKKGKIGIILFHTYEFLILKISWKLKIIAKMKLNSMVKLRVSKKSWEQN